ncbi:hypothetical protein JB92DRAFT_2824502 [Gautieria morchelliformis]|nr:hypothetical protein JB92DRAFT_2824502 [Gautieria morchelliformis]
MQSHLVFEVLIGAIVGRSRRWRMRFSGRWGLSTCAHWHAEDCEASSHRPAKSEANIPYVNQASHTDEYPTCVRWCIVHTTPKRVIQAAELRIDMPMERECRRLRCRVPLALPSPLTQFFSLLLPQPPAPPPKHNPPVGGLHKRGELVVVCRAGEAGGRGGLGLWLKGISMRLVDRGRQTRRGMRLPLAGGRPEGKTRKPRLTEGLPPPCLSPRPAIHPLPLLPLLLSEHLELPGQEVPELPSLPPTPDAALAPDAGAAYRCPKLFEYRFPVGREGRGVCAATCMDDDVRDRRGRRRRDGTLGEAPPPVTAAVDADPDPLRREWRRLADGECCDCTEGNGRKDGECGEWKEGEPSAPEERMALLNV